MSKVIYLVFTSPRYLSVVLASALFLGISKQFARGHPFASILDLKKKNDTGR